MDELEFRNEQKRALEKIFSGALYAPTFKPNAKYCNGPYAKKYGYISLDDVMENRYRIRVRPNENNVLFHSGNEEVLAEYDGADPLVDDGWRLD